MDGKLLVVICGCFIQLVNSKLNYIDCGSSFEITSVELQYCHSTPCSIQPGEMRTLTVNAKNLVPDIEYMQTRAYVSFFGQFWELNVTPNSPCLDWGCPLHESRSRTFRGDVNFNATIIRRPGVLRLQTTTYDRNHGNQVALCITLDLDFI